MIGLHTRGRCDVCGDGALHTCKASSLFNLPKAFEVCLLETPVKLRQNACLVICSMCAITDLEEPVHNISKLQGKMKMSYHSTAADLC